CIPDPRDPRYTVHQQRTLLAQRIFAIALGYEDLNDHQTLRNDPALQTTADCSPEIDDPMGSPSTLCRLENRISRSTLAKLSEVLVEQFLASHRVAPDEIVLDLDATDDPTHGDQQGRFFHGYYRHYCFLPLYVFCGDQILCAYLRPSNIDAAKHSRAIVKLLVQRIRQEWPDVKITLRADSGFCRRKLMRWCEKHEVSYIFGIARNPALQRLASPLMKEAEERFTATQAKQRLFAETQYAAQSWDRERRVIIKAERLEQGANPRFVVTNLPGDPQTLYDELYVQRGDMENRIKEQQLMLFADRTSCHDFLANQFRLLLSSFAYALVESLRRLGLKDTEMAKAQVGTIRLVLFKIAAQVKLSFRRVTFRLASCYPYQPLFRHVYAALLRPG
ncbi:MAG: IS1380 family transposase, partial [Planctomycetota bacterium]